MYLERLIQDAYQDKFGIDVKPHQVRAFLEEADKINSISAKIALLPDDVYLVALKAAKPNAPKKKKRKQKSDGEASGQESTK
jgi:hypothetical protein